MKKKKKQKKERSMVREINASSSESEIETEYESERESSDEMFYASSSESDPNEGSKREGFFEPFVEWSQECKCQTDYRGEEDESNCPRCLKTVTTDNTSCEMDWSVIERNCTVTKKSFKQFWNEIKWRFQYSDTIDENRQISADKIENSFADDEDNESVDIHLNKKKKKRTRRRNSRLLPEERVE